MVYGQDDDRVPYSEFLGLARDEGLVGLDVQVVQAPSDANGHRAVVHVTARASGTSFTAVGEASPSSAPEAWHAFLTTLAELRAKARALRELTGLEHSVLEELSVPYRGDEVTLSGGLSERRPAPPAANSAPIRSMRVVGERTDSDEDGGGEGEDREGEQRPPAGRLAFGVPEDEGGLDPDMVAKLKKLTVSISALEGDDLSDAEATQKLDDFFMRAFKHPMARGSRIEGQRVVQRLSGELASRRAATNNDEE